jgi:hypothetical protein
VVAPYYCYDLSAPASKRTRVPRGNNSLCCLLVCGAPPARASDWMRKFIRDAWLEFYSGEMPKSPDEPVTTQKLLARLYIMPHTMRVEPDNALASGEVSWCRIVGTSGDAVADFVVSRKDGPGWMTFNTLEFRKGGPVSFFGRMAIFSSQRVDDDVTASIHGSAAGKQKLRELHREWHAREVERRRRTGEAY